MNWPNRRCLPKTRSSAALSKDCSPNFATPSSTGCAPRKSKSVTVEIESKLDQASEMLARNEEYSGIYFFTNSALIILREGLEATLVLPRS